MTIEIRLERIRQRIDKIRRYNHLVVEDSLEPATLEDMEGNVGTLCDEIKTEADQIKVEAGQWT